MTTRIGVAITDNIPDDPRPLGRLRRPHKAIPTPLALLRTPWREQQPTSLDYPKVTQTRDLSVHPELSTAASSMTVAGAPEAAGSVRRVAVGGPEDRGLLGMLSRMSIQIPMGPRGTQTDFSKNRKKASF